jgi:hypothetical protein
MILWPQIYRLTLISPVASLSLKASENPGSHILSLQHALTWNSSAFCDIIIFEGNRLLILQIVLWSGFFWCSIQGLPSIGGNEEEMCALSTLYQEVHRVICPNINWWWWSSFFGGAAVLGFELRALRLVGRHWIAWATPPARFSLVVSEIRSCFLPRLV